MAWGNLANRVLTFAYRNFDRQVPVPGALGELDQALLDQVADAFDPILGQLRERA